MNLGMFGAAAALGIAAVGSALGIGIAGQAAIGAWKRNFVNNKPASFILTAFAGAPLTQTMYGFLLMLFMKNNIAAGTAPSDVYYLGLGIFAGLAMAASAIAQGKAGAAGSDAMGETGKGFILYIMVVGLCETVALFVMAFAMMMLKF